MPWNWPRPTSSDGTRRQNIIRDWLLPLNLDTNHGYAKEQVVNSELAKRQVVVQGRAQRLQQLAQTCRVRLGQLRQQDEQLEAHVSVYEQRRNELLSQVSQFEEAGRTEERNYFPDPRPASSCPVGSTTGQDQAGKERATEASPDGQM